MLLWESYSPPSLSSLHSTTARTLKTQSRKAVFTMELRTKAVLSSPSPSPFGNAPCLSHSMSSLFHFIFIPLSFLPPSFSPTTPASSAVSYAWIQADHLPGSFQAVSFLKLGILHCPKIYLYASRLGYCLRCKGENVATWLCFISSSLPPLPAQLSSGPNTVRQELLKANPHNSASCFEIF